MGWTPEGSLGTNSIKTGSALTFSPDSDVAPGQVVVLWVGTDSVFNVGLPLGNLDPRWACHDDAGNIWTTLGVETDEKAFFKSGAAAVIFISQLRAGLLTSDVISITNQAEANIDAKCVSAYEFSIGENMVWATTDSGPIEAKVNVADPPSISIGQLPDREYLLLHCLASEGPNTDAFTWDSDYTQIDPVGTTGGADDTNIALRGGFRVATLTSDTVNVTSDTADRDNSQILVAVCEIPRVPFPNTPILDDFNRAAEDPLSKSGAWHPTWTAGPSSPGSPRFLGTDGDEAYGGVTGGGGSYWDDFFVNCVEVYATQTAVSGGDFDGWDLVWHGQNSTENSNAFGHAVAWRTERFGHWLHDNIEFGDMGLAGAVGEGFTRSWAYQAIGAKLGVQRTRGVVDNTWCDRLYIDVGDGWEPLAAIQFNPVGFQVWTDGLIGAAIWDTATRIDDFGGGQIRCSFGRFLPQIIRRPPEGPFVE